MSDQVAPENAENKEETAGPAEALVRDLRALRRLAGQMHRRAASADGHMLRAIIGKREALLTSIRGHVSAAPAALPAMPADAFGRALGLSAQEKEAISETLKEIMVLDAESDRILRSRAEELGAEIRHVKAGRKSRESYRTWT